MSSSKAGWGRDNSPEKDHKDQALYGYDKRFSDTSNATHKVFSGTEDDR